MACSEARLAANRANALKSTGPRTEAGKEASRRNGLKHGLTGSGVVVPGEDAAEVGREAAALLVELAPDGLPTAVLLAERVATLAVRLRRSARHEFAATSERAHRAADEFDAARRAEAERLFGAIEEGANRAELRSMPEGVDLLDAALAELGAAAGAGRWTREDAVRLARCLPTGGWDEVAAANKDQIIGRIATERAGLGAVRARLDLAAVDRARAEAVDRALVDDAPETLRARRYEAVTERALFRALKEIREIRRPARAVPGGPVAAPPAALIADRGGPARRAEPAPALVASSPLGSSFPEVVGVSAGAHKSGAVDVGAAPRGRSRYEDRRKRPKLGR